MSDPEKALKRSFRRRQIPNDEGYLSEKLLLYKRKRCGYVGELTKTIDKIEKCLVNNDDSKINNYEKRLEETISKIYNITTKLNNLVFKKSEHAFEFCTEQRFRVITIGKTIDFYNSEKKFEKLPEKYLVQNDKPQIKSTSQTVSNVHLDFDNKKTSPLRKTRVFEPEKPCSLNRSVKGENTKSQLCSSKSSHSSKSKNTLSIHSKTFLSKSSSSRPLSNSGSSSSSKYSNAYYLSLNERRKSSKQAQLVAKQAEERAKRQLKLLEKSFELETQKITEEVLVAREGATRVEFNNYLDEALPYNPEKKSCSF